MFPNTSRTSCSTHRIHPENRRRLTSTASCARRHAKTLGILQCVMMAVPVPFTIWICNIAMEIAHRNRWFAMIYLLKMVMSHSHVSHNHRVTNMEIYWFTGIDRYFDPRWWYRIFLFSKQIGLGWWSPIITAGWWFPTFVIFHNIYILYMGCHPSHWLVTHIFQDGYCTTNHYCNHLQWFVRGLETIKNHQPDMDQTSCHNLSPTEPPQALPLQKAFIDLSHPAMPNKSNCSQTVFSQGEYDLEPRKKGLD